MLNSVGVHHCHLVKVFSRLLFASFPEFVPLMRHTIFVEIVREERIGNVFRIGYPTRNGTGSMSIFVATENH